MQFDFRNFIKYYLSEDYSKIRDEIPLSHDIIENLIEDRKILDAFGIDLLINNIQNYQTVEDIGFFKFSAPEKRIIHINNLSHEDSHFWEWEID